MQLVTHILDNALFGICVVDLNSGSVKHNDKCRSICSCGPDDGIDGNHHCVIKELAARYPTEGLFYRGSLSVNDHLYDVVFIREDVRTTCVLYPQEKKLASFEKILREAKLTQRELEITSMVILGMTNEKVCEKLKITKNTLRTHLKSVYRKLPPHRLEVLGLFRKI